jgi:hypothetical protein
MNSLEYMSAGHVFIKNHQYRPYIFILPHQYRDLAHHLLELV